MPLYPYPRQPYETPRELKGAPARRYPVVVVGAGPIGLTVAIDLALHDIDVLLLDDNDVVSIGSRSICWAKRTLEILDRLGVGERMQDKGVTWKRGRVFHRERELFGFDLLPEDGHKMPAFVNLQQYYAEEYLVDRARELGNRLELRWKNKAVGIEPSADRVRLQVETPDGAYWLESDYVLAADGAKSTIRRLLGLSFEGRLFDERFLIADVHMKADFPSERWFWFEPPFHDGRSALLHRQPDDIFRLDFQLGADADPEIERRPERVLPRIRAMVGERPFELDWCSVYTFQCARLERFVHGRVIFLGDSAHVVSPFGARGGNGGIQDADNLAWKLAMVLKGEAPDRLLLTYDEERIPAADDNIRNSSRSTSFMTPKTAAERLFRDTVLELAANPPFARALVNSGRLSRPYNLAGLSLQSPDDGVDGAMIPGSPCIDAPVTTIDGRPTWLLEHLGGGFTLLLFAGAGGEPPDLEGLPRVRLVVIGEHPVQGATVLVDRDGVARERYGGAPGVTYLIRPDQHVSARFARFDPAAIRRALLRATARAA